MAEEEMKRKAEESVIEKIYKKIKKMEDHYYELKKSTASSKNSTASSDNGAGPSTRDDATHNSSELSILQLLESDSPNTESDNQDGSCSEQDLVQSEPVEMSIDEEALKILGEDPSLNTPKEFKIHSDVASRWKAWIGSSLEKETRTELLKSYSRVGNCPLEAPILNAELVSTLNETSVKRDKHFADSQCLIGSAMSALGSAITMLLNDRKEGVDRNELLRVLCDSGKLLADLHHKESVARKAYILPGLDKRAKTILGKIETDIFLFGENLAEKLKSAKAVEKAGLDLKLQPAKPQTQKAPFKKNPVNWKSPPVKHQWTNQAGNNFRGSSPYRPRGGRAQQENRKPEQVQAHDEKSSKTKE